MGKEIPMNAIEMVVILTLVRLVLPFGLLLVIGEWIHGYERARIYRM